MTHSRFLSSAAFLAALWLASPIAQAAEPTPAGVGPLPAEALVLPSDVSFVMGLDVKRLVASPLYERLKKNGAMKPGTLGELEKAAGIVPERDLRSFVMAGNVAGDAAMLVFGQFDLPRVAAAIEADGKATKSMLEGIPTYLGPGTKGKNQMLLALVDPGMLALGTPARVEAMLTARSGRTQPFLAGGRLAGVVRNLGPGAAFWMVGDGNLTQGMPGGPGGMSIPSLESVVMTGTFAPDLALSLTGNARDAAEAKKLADMLRGLIALGAMQGGQKPELQALVAGLTVTSEEAKVTVEARVAYDILDTLVASMPKPAAPGAEPGPR